MLLVGDAPLLSMHMAIPERGPWRASVSCSFEPRDDIVILDDTDQAYEGAVVNGGIVGGRWNAFIVGGTGGLSSQIGSKNYQNTTAKTVAKDICTDAGEAFSPLSDPSVANTPLGSWTRGSMRAREALSELCNDIGAHWTVRPDGAVALREMGYEDQEPAEALVMDEDFIQDSLTLSLDGLWLRPGMMQQGRRVKRVVYYLEHNLRAVAYV